MKFLFVIDHLGAGGAQRQVVRQAELLAEAGHDVCIYSYLRLKSPYRLHPKIESVADHIVDGKLRGFRRVIGIRRQIRRLRPDWVVSFLDIPTLLTSFAIRGSRVKFAPSKRSRMALGLPWLSRGWISKWVLYRAERITCNSRAVMREIVEAFPAIAGRVRIIPNIIDLGGSQCAKSDTSIVITGNALRVACVGRLVEGKEPMTVARALVTTCRSNGAIEVHWFGEPIDLDLKARVDALLAQEHLTEKWVWRGVEDEMPRRLVEFDVLVHASRSESMPNAVLEAATSGCVLVLSNIEAHRDLCHMGVHASLFDVGDAIVLGRILQRIAADLRRHKELARETADLVRSTFSASAVVVDLMRCFETGPRSQSIC